MSLSENIKLIEECLAKLDKDVEIELTVNASIHDDTPDGFVEEETTLDNQSRFHKVVDAKNGKATKTITLFIPM